MTERKLLELSQELDYESLIYLCKNDTKFKALCTGPYKQEYEQILKKKRDEQLLVSIQMEDENLLYEISQNLTLNELKNLCVSNHKTRLMCQTERFQQLIERKIQEKEEEKEAYYRDLVNKIYNKIRKTNRFHYDLFKSETRFANHYISYNLNDRNRPRLFEFIGVQSRKYIPGESILKGLFKQRVNSYNLLGQAEFTGYGPFFEILNPTGEEIKRVLNILVHQSDFDTIILIR